MITMVSRVVLLNFGGIVTLVSSVLMRPGIPHGVRGLVRVLGHALHSGDGLSGHRVGLLRMVHRLLIFLAVGRCVHGCSLLLLLLLDCSNLGCLDLGLQLLLLVLLLLQKLELEVLELELLLLLQALLLWRLGRYRLLLREGHRAGLCRSGGGYLL